ncbi:MAG: FAD-dependent oxidoreductase [Peptococcaceae bacterium]|nr:FAD-dependent oxidoreductase [Peptococcaceae bacterium]
MRQYETDVAVVAAGPAGLAAAVSAAERGAAVIVCEKANTTGGTGNMGMGPLGIETRLQRQRMIGLTVEEAFRHFMDHTHWRVDARLVKTYFEKSADTIHWLEEMGVEFLDAARYFPGSQQTWHIVKPASGPPGPRAASTMYKIMTERAEELGVEFLLETPVKKILMENGRAAGVVAEDKSGEAVQIRAGAVIVATGGFGNNPKMVKDYLGYEIGKDLFPFLIPGIEGDGLRMAWEAGAGKSEMNMEIIFGIPGVQDSEITDFPFRQPSSLFVNLSGIRFMSEELTEHTTYTGNAIAIQPKRCAFSIIDSAAVKHYRKNGLELRSMVHPNINMNNFEEAIQKLIDEGNPNVFIADSLDELAEKTGIDAKGLKETVAEYNRGCEKREDFFYKKNRYLRPLQGPKFYAGRFFPGGYGSLGGIKINYKTEVLTDEAKVIPGLYAAGTDACSIYGDSYVFTLPGNTMGFALNTGRIAGENAAAYVESLTVPGT